MCACMHCNYLTPISHLLWFDFRKPEFYFAYLYGVSHDPYTPCACGWCGFLWEGVGGSGGWEEGSMDDTLTIAIAK